VTQAQKATQRFVGSNFSPAWSLDGQLLAYLSSRRQGLFERDIIAIRSLKTGEERDLSPNLLEVWEPIRWSPDSRNPGFPVNKKCWKIRIKIFLGDPLAAPIEHGKGDDR